MGSKLEDHWYSSSVRGFNFDDELDLGKELSPDATSEDLDEVFNSTLVVSNNLPTNSIISRKNFDLVLKDIVLPVDQKFEIDFNNLYSCCRLEDKLLLLDKAIETYDGDLILKVVFHLMRTLKSNIFYRHLGKRPIALQQYANYLIKCNLLQELEILQLSTESKYNFSHSFYASTRKTSVNNINKKIAQFPVDSLDGFETSIFKEYRKFIQANIDNKLEADSATAMLAEIYNKRIASNESLSDSKVLEFIKLMRLSDFQSEWIAMNVIASNGAWPKIMDMFMKANWFTKKSGVKTCVNLEMMVSALHKHDAPNDILYEFLSSMDDTDRSLYLGKKVKCHQYVIDTLSTKRDRLGLISYKDCVPPQSDLTILIENALRNPDKKWIN